MKIKDFILYLACLIQAEDYSAVRGSSQKAKQKVITTSILLMIPVMIWMFTAYFMLSTILNVGRLESMIGAIIAASVILIVDTSFMKAGQSNWVKVYRLLIVLISCFIGSIGLDLAIFHDDIDQYVEQIRIEEYSENFDEKNKLLIDDVSSLEQRVEVKKVEVSKLHELYYDEMNGLYKSGSGYGEIAKKKEQAWSQAKTELDLMRIKLQSKKDELSAKMLDGVELEVAKGGVLTHLRALWLLAQNDIQVKRIWQLLMAFIILLEYAPLFVKSRMDNTDYDKWKELDEFVKTRKLNLMKLEAQRREERVKQYTEDDVIAVDVINSLKHV